MSSIAVTTRHRAVVALAAVAALVLATGCTGGSATGVAEAAEPARPAAATPTAAAAIPAPPASRAPAPAAVAAPVAKPRPKPKPVSKASIDIKVGTGSTTGRPLPLNAPVTITAVRGRLSTVAVTNAEGALAGSSTPTGTRWTSSEPLAPASTYTIRVSAVDAAGLQTARTMRFTTIEPAGRLRTRIAPLNGETVGVGMPVIIYFNHPVKDKAAVERTLRVTSSSGVVGSWHWLHKKEVHFRPKVYWPARETVRVDVGLNGVDAGNGVWGVESRSISFKIGRSHTSLVDARTHTMTVKEDGKVVRKFAVSTGRDEFPTSSGVHVVMSKDAEYWMDSATIGIPRKAPGGYYKKVLYNVRISNSGEFVHAAPWSAADQGRRNVSHGCVNASVADAAWFLRFSRRGDIVDVVGTPRKLQLGNGFADWTLSWKAWAAGSALAQKTA